MLYLTYRSFFCGENLVAVASIVHKWARFDLKWAWSEIFRARSPPTFNIFLRLCRCSEATQLEIDWSWRLPLL